MEVDVESKNSRLIILFRSSPSLIDFLSRYMISANLSRTFRADQLLGLSTIDALNSH